MPSASLAASFAAVSLPSSARAAFATATPAALVALGRQLYPYLALIPDPRGRQGRRYELALLVMFCVVGFCTGCQGYLSVARWGRALPPDVLREFGFTKGRTPCAATWLNLFRVLDWDLVAAQFQAWAEAACLPGVPVPAPATPAPTTADPPWQGFAVDGKTLRGSRKVDAEAAHDVSVVAQGSGVSVREVGVAQKEGELTVAPDLLASVLGPGRVFTGDALFTQRALCHQIREGQSHYVLIVKENQPTLLAQIEAVLGPVTAREARLQQRRGTSQANAGHGRRGAGHGRRGAVRRPRFARGGGPDDSGGIVVRAGCNCKHSVAYLRIQRPDALCQLNR